MQNILETSILFASRFLGFLHTFSSKSLSLSCSPLCCSLKQISLDIHFVVSLKSIHISDNDDGNYLLGSATLHSSVLEVAYKA